MAGFSATAGGKKEDAGEKRLDRSLIGGALCRAGMRASKQHTHTTRTAAPLLKVIWRVIKTQAAAAAAGGGGGADGPSAPSALIRFTSCCAAGQLRPPSAPEPMSS